MSAQRAVPSSVSASRSAGALIAALVVGMAIGAVAMSWYWLSARLTSSPFHRAARAASPDGSRVAIAFERECDQLVCGELRVGLATDETSAKAMIDTYRDSTCDEIVWTPDGKRIGFLMTGQQLVIYDAQTLKHLGNVRLLTQEAAATRRARGVTFSENGRAVTFDDCPRGHSGCRAGVVGIPQ
jgi:hypothetical protein